MVRVFVGITLLLPQPPETIDVLYFNCQNETVPVAQMDLHHDANGILATKRDAQSDYDQVPKSKAYIVGRKGCGPLRRAVYGAFSALGTKRTHIPTTIISTLPLEGAHNNSPSHHEMNGSMHANACFKISLE